MTSTSESELDRRSALQGVVLMNPATRLADLRALLDELRGATE